MHLINLKLPFTSNLCVPRSFEFFCGNTRYKTYFDISYNETSTYWVFQSLTHPNSSRWLSLTLIYYFQDGISYYVARQVLGEFLSSDEFNVYYLNLWLTGSDFMITETQNKNKLYRPRTAEIIPAISGGLFPNRLHFL